MEAHEDLNATNQLGRWRLRLHADGRAEVLEFTPAGARRLRVLAPPELVDARREFCSACELLGKAGGPCPCVSARREANRNLHAACPDRRVGFPAGYSPKP